MKDQRYSIKDFGLDGAKAIYVDNGHGFDVSIAKVLPVDLSVDQPVDGAADLVAAANRGLDRSSTYRENLDELFRVLGVDPWAEGLPDAMFKARERLQQLMVVEVREAENTLVERTYTNVWKQAVNVARAQVGLPAATVEMGVTPIGVVEELMREAAAKTDVANPWREAIEKAYVDLKLDVGTQPANAEGLLRHLIGHCVLNAAANAIKVDQDWARAVADERERCALNRTDLILDPAGSVSRLVVRAKAIGEEPWQEAMLAELQARGIPIDPGTPEALLKRLTDACVRYGRRDSSTLWRDDVLRQCEGVDLEAKDPGGVVMEKAGNPWRDAIQARLRQLSASPAAPFFHDPIPAVETLGDQERRGALAAVLDYLPTLLHRGMADLQHELGNPGTLNSNGRESSAQDKIRRGLSNMLRGEMRR